MKSDYRMPRGRHGGGGGGGAGPGASTSVSAELARTVAASPALPAPIQHSLATLAGDIRNGEVARAAVIQAGVLDTLLGHLENESKSNAR